MIQLLKYNNTQKKSNIMSSGNITLHDTSNIYTYIKMINEMKSNGITSNLLHQFSRHR